jgi:hypothetical protein
MRPSLWLCVVPCDAMCKLAPSARAEYTSALNVLVNGKVHPLYEPGYIVTCVANFTEEISYVNMFYYRHMSKFGARGSCLRHYATSRKVAGSIPDEVI